MAAQEGRELAKRAIFPAPCPAIEQQHARSIAFLERTLRNPLRRKLVIQFTQPHSPSLSRAWPTERPPNALEILYNLCYQTHAAHIDDPPGRGGFSSRRCRAARHCSEASRISPVRKA